MGTFSPLRTAAPMVGAAGMSQPLGQGELVPRDPDWDPDGGPCLLWVTGSFGLLALNAFWRGKMQIPFFFFPASIQEESLIKYEHLLLWWYLAHILSLEWEKKKGEDKLFVKDTFPPPDRSAFSFFSSTFLFSWVSFCFVCLFILYANYLHALVNLWSKYCGALNVKLNLNPFEKVGNCSHKPDFPHTPFFVYAWHGKVGKQSSP